MRKLLLAAALLCAAPAWAGDEWIRGRVVRLDAVRSKITLKHGPIRTIGMSAMTMPFKVKDAASLVALKVGDEVRFQVVESDGQLLIHQIEVRP